MDNFTLQDVRNLRGWFQYHVKNDKGQPFILDDDQATIVLQSHKNALVTARAGSGKTSTLLAKIVWNYVRHHIPLSQMAVFVFNTKVATEINTRLSKITIDGIPLADQRTPINVAMTFHAFANRVAGQSWSASVISGRERSRFIKHLIDEYGDKKKIYEFIRGIHEKNKDTDPRTKQEYYHSLRDSTQCTLDGHVVKSAAEKVIADFLFEHHIAYTYEPSLFLKHFRSLTNSPQSLERLQAHPDVVKPDFYLERYQIFWEHWAIRGDESPQEIAELNDAWHEDDAYAKYLANKTWKEWFYGKEWVDCSQNIVLDNELANTFLNAAEPIYTFRDFPQSRVEFEEYLAATLLERGITEAGDTPDFEQLYAQVWQEEKNQDRIVGLVESFIDRAEQQFFDDYSRLEQLIRDCPNPQAQLFYEIAYPILRQYLEILPSPHKPEALAKYNNYSNDYNGWLVQASKLLNTAADDSSLGLPIDSWRYIMIDEYQDFNELFYQTVTALRTHCPQARLLCVGDDWQAINSYMGADLKFFLNFTDYYNQDSATYRIKMNYRSGNDIVENANIFMQQALLDPEGCSSETKPSRIRQRAVDKVWVDFTSTQHNPDQIYLDACQRKSIWTRYAKAIVEIIERNPHETFLFLSRKGQLSFCPGSLTDFKKCIERIIVRRGIMTRSEYDQRVSFKTVHTAKGLEAHTAVLLDADPGIFPLHHPDNQLFELFGCDSAKELDEQKRLFYVAITRAKEELYILYDSQKLENTNKPSFLALLDKQLCKPWYSTEQAMAYVERTKYQKMQISISHIENQSDRYIAKLTTNEIDPVVIIQKTTHSRYNELATWLIQKLSKSTGEKTCLILCGQGLNHKKYWRMKFREIEDSIRQKPAHA